MASTNFTTHYSIPLPLGTDLTTPMDYNEAAEAVDTALFGAVTDAGNASEAAGEAVNTANAAAEAAGDIGADLALEKAKIVQLQTRMTAAENDIDDVYTDVTDMITAYKEPSATSTHAYAIGDYFIYNETLYKATAAIAIGATIVPNTNCEATNISTELIQINSDLTQITSTTVDISVVGNGVKTRSQLLNELYALVDRSKVSFNMMLQYRSEYYHASVIDYNNNVLGFGGVHNESSGLSVIGITIQSSGSLWESSLIKDDNTIVHYDSSSDVIPEGVGIGIKYGR